MSEIHISYAPVASATNVINYTAQVGTTPNPGQNAMTGNVPNANINDPDNTTGSNSYVIPNQSSNISVVGKVVHGRYNPTTVINNPA